MALEIKINRCLTGIIIIVFINNYYVSTSLSPLFFSYSTAIHTIICEVSIHIFLKNNLNGCIYYKKNEKTHIWRGYSSMQDKMQSERYKIRIWMKNFFSETKTQNVRRQTSWKHAFHSHQKDMTHSHDMQWQRYLNVCVCVRF